MPVLEGVPGLVQVPDMIDLFARGNHLIAAETHEEVFLVFD
jgi:hypothetical protein